MDGEQHTAPAVNGYAPLAFVTARYAHALPDRYHATAALRGQTACTLQCRSPGTRTTTRTRRCTHCAHFARTHCAPADRYRAGTRTMVLHLYRCARLRDYLVAPVRVARTSHCRDETIVAIILESCWVDSWYGYLLLEAFVTDEWR